MIKRWEIINYIIEFHGYQRYLEIGVDQKHTWNEINVPNKVGVDPNAKTTFKTKSDNFFKQNKDSFDIIFIDGFHERDQVLRDVYNSLECLNDNGTIVLHDCNPREIKRLHPMWSGNVWEAVAILRSTRPDLSMYTIDEDTGMCIIKRDHQNVIDIPDILDYEFLDEHRQSVLNLITFDEFKRIMNQNTNINMFWNHGPINETCRICIESFTHFYDINLYSYDEKANPNIPGCKFLDASDILDFDLVEPIIKSVKEHKQHGIISDVFRYKLLHEFGGWWFDCDYFLLKPFGILDDREIILSEFSAHGVKSNGIVNGVMKFPAGHEFTKRLFDTCLRMRDPEWGDTGPKIIRPEMRRLKLDKYVISWKIFHPLPGSKYIQRYMFANSFVMIYNETLAVHLWNHKNLIRLAGHHGHTFDDSILLGRLPQEAKRIRLLHQGEFKEPTDSYSTHILREQSSISPKIS
ncbi:MAG: hypothetical protein GF411_13925 [Candidatus Lokiarchaeota archaeon]|nr:hypothetical protein [Candidatus Lokiarchaeota archaeon]